MISIGRPITKIIGGCISAFIGMFLLVVLVLGVTHKDYIGATAKVIKTITNEDNENVSILQFEAGGKIYEAEGFPGITYEVGEDVYIKYNPENPNEFDIGGDDESNFVGLILGSATLLLGIIGIVSGINDVRFITNTLRNIK